MNIFVLDSTPSAAARYHCDSHVVKMILESAQLMSTAHFVTSSPGCSVTSLDGTRTATLHGKRILFPTHANHPCSRWVREIDSNYDWLHSLAVHLCVQYTKRYGKEHALEATIRGPLAVIPSRLTSGPCTPFVQAMPEVYRQPDAVLAYRFYYIGMKMGFARWRHSPSPEWLESTYEMFDKLELPYGTENQGGNGRRSGLEV